MKKLNIIKEFSIPIFVLLSILISLVLYSFLISRELITILLLITILIGSLELIKETLESLLKKRFALDYIAILAISTGVIAGEYLVATVIVLMLSGGNSLERYAMNKAKESLGKLIDRIPNKVSLVNNDEVKIIKIEEAKIGDIILVKKGEVIPLDGELLSESALIDESTLTGEADPKEKLAGFFLRSSTINIGEAIQIKVKTEEKDSTYKKIIEMVREAQEEKSPIVRLADKYSVIFTIITFIIATIAFILSKGDINRILAVLVIATPCPLILATPIALIGGINSAARKQIIIKRGGALEILAKVSAIVFDKTGTITIGKPKLDDIEILDKAYTSLDCLSIAASIEANSLHPYAKAIIQKATHEKVKLFRPEKVKERLGVGISALINNKEYTLSRSTGQGDMVMSHNNKDIAIFHFRDYQKPGSEKVLSMLTNSKIKLLMFTGDRYDKAKKLTDSLGIKIDIHADLTPEGKKEGITNLKQEGEVTAMIGDGINDAPALAMADVGMVFSNDEDTASSEAADVVFLNGDITAVSSALFISKLTINIAMQSILFGIGLSVIGMIFASFGLIIPLAGAFIQEAIDVAVIFNALRTSRIKI